MYATSSNRSARENTGSRLQMALHGLVTSAGLQNLKVELYDWPSSLGLRIHDIGISGDLWDGRRIRGRGTDFEYTVAAAKAVSEIVERFTLIMRSEGPLNSNGWAAHFEEDRARIEAFHEIVERDLFFSHYLTRTPFKIIDYSECSEWVREACEFIESEYAVETVFGKMSDSYEGIAACSVAMFGGEKFGVITGQSAKPRIEESISKSFLDCLRNLAAVIISPNKYRAILLDAFSEIVNPTPFDHFCVGLSKEIAEEVRKLYKEKADFFDDKISRMSALTRTKFNRYPEVYPGSPVVVSALNADFQGVFYGLPKKRFVNLERLRIFSGNRDFSAEMLPEFPHTHH